MSAAPGLEPVVRAGLRRRPSLALVPPRRTAPPAAVLGRTPFVGLVVSLLVAGLLGLLALNTALAQDAFRLHTLKQDARALEDREQVLQREVEALRAPQELAERASALGMVQAGPPAFLRLSDGVVLGAEIPAEAPQPAGQDAPDAPDAPAAEAGSEQAARDEAGPERAATDEAGPEQAATDEAGPEQAATDEAGGQ